MTPRVRISVVGLGFMGRRWARVIAEHPGAELALVCDVNEIAAREVAEQLHCSWSTDPGEEAAKGGVEGLVLCTPEHMHTDIALAAIEAGQAIAVEKPMAHDLAGATRIRDVAAHTGIPVLAAHILRFESRYAGMRAAVEQGRIGAVQAIRSARIGVIHDQAVLRGRTSIPLYYGVHELDLARWFAGDIISVTAHRTSGVLKAAGYDVDDLYSILIGFAGGAHGTSVIGWSLPNSTAGSGLSGFTVIGEHGFLSVRQDETGFVGFDEDGPMSVDSWYAPVVHGHMAGALANEVHHFVQVVSGAVDPLCTAADGLEAVRASLAVEQSAIDGRTVQTAQLQEPTASAVGATQEGR